MERLIHYVSVRLNKEILDWESEIEQDKRKLAAKTCKCIGACSSNTEEIDEFKNCVAECEIVMNTAMDELKSRLNNIQNELQTCIQTCSPKTANSEDDELRVCLNKCSDVVSTKMIEMRQISKDIIKKYV